MSLVFVILVFLIPVSGQKQDCPMILITGPAGISLPGEEMTFVVEVRGDRSEKLSFRWEITGGTITGGQGTPILKANYNDRWKFKASVKVGGLPTGCPAEASDVLHFSGPHAVPENLGSISNAYTIDSATLKRIRESLSSNEGSQLFVWIYPRSSSDKRNQFLRSHILRQLSKTDIDPSRFTIQFSSEKSRGVIFWRVPAGTENPAP